MIRLIHAADFHLDAPFAALASEQAAQCRQQQRETLIQLVQLCRQQQCQLLLLAGDLFDRQEVFTDTVQTLQQALARCGVPVFIAPGNHDPIQPGSPYLQPGWPENVHIFQKNTPQTVDMGSYTVSGAAFCGNQAPSLEGFCAPNDGRPHFMVLHGDPLHLGSAYSPITKAQIEASGLTYLALGHIHKRGGPSKQGRSVYAWPGCLMGRGFDETGDKGVLFCCGEPDFWQVQFMPLDAPRYEILQVAVQEDALQTLEAALPPDTGRDHYRIVLTGTCPAPDCAMLHRQLAPQFASLTLEDHTRRPVTIPEPSDSSPEGLFVQILQQTMAHTTDAKTLEALALAQELGVCAMEGREVRLP